MNKEPNIYDYAIIGFGAAGINLLSQLSRLKNFEQQSILIIDKGEFEQNTKTWSFWHKENVEFNHLIHHSWNQLQFFGGGRHQVFLLKPYQYSTIQSSDFYNYGLSIIEQSNNCIYHKLTVEHLSETTEFVEVRTGSQTFYAKQVFDSRVPTDFTLNEKSYTGVRQHFLGWVIEAAKPIVNQDVATVMDFRIKEPKSTSFTYVLPFSERKALVEFTYFSPEVRKAETYETYIRNYIKNVLRTDDYKIIEKEFGNIPMNTYPFYEHHSHKITKIGTGGGALKPSSGYSFYNSYKVAQQIKLSIENGEHYQPKPQSKYQFYDEVFLSILQNNNELGEQLFKQFYVNNKIHKTFEFLDNESAYKTDLEIISSFLTPKLLPYFLRAAWRYFS